MAGYFICCCYSIYGLCSSSLPLLPVSRSVDDNGCVLVITFGIWILCVQIFRLLSFRARIAINIGSTRFYIFPISHRIWWAASCWRHFTRSCRRRRSNASTLWTLLLTSMNNSIFHTRKKRAEDKSIAISHVNLHASLVQISISGRNVEMNALAHTHMQNNNNNNAS